MFIWDENELDDVEEWPCQTNEWDGYKEADEGLHAEQLCMWLIELYSGYVVEF